MILASGKEQLSCHATRNTPTIKPGNIAVETNQIPIQSTTFQKLSGINTVNKLLSFADRDIFLLSPSGNGHPAVFLICDQQAGGVLVNCPAFSEALLAEINALCPLRYIFLPSHFGAQDLDLWRKASGAQSLALDAEIPDIRGTIDLVVDRQSKLTRTIGFLPMSGRTPGSCALHLRNLPGVIFFGPIFSRGVNGWPALVAMPDDASFENRLIGALGLQDFRYAYTFCDDYTEHDSHTGPDASIHIHQAIQHAIDDTP